MITGKNMVICHVKIFRENCLILSIKKMERFNKNGQQNVSYVVLTGKFSVDKRTNNLSIPNATWLNVLR